VAVTRKDLRRAIVETQHALAVAETGDGVDPKLLARIARTLRSCLVNLDCLGDEVDAVMRSASSNGAGAGPAVNARGGDA
jgi:hypothetical protein